MADILDTVVKMAAQYAQLSDEEKAREEEAKGKVRGLRQLVPAIEVGEDVDEPTQDVEISLQNMIKRNLTVNEKVESLTPI